MMLASIILWIWDLCRSKWRGEVVFEGTPKEMITKNTLTSNYLNGKLKIAVPENDGEETANGWLLKGRPAII